MRAASMVLFFLSLGLLVAAEDAKPAEIALSIDKAQVIQPFPGPAADLARDASPAATVVAAVVVKEKETRLAGRRVPSVGRVAGAEEPAGRRALQGRAAERSGRLRSDGEVTLDH